MGGKTMVFKINKMVYVYFWFYGIYGFYILGF